MSLENDISGILREFCKKIKEEYGREEYGVETETEPTTEPTTKPATPEKKPKPNTPLRPTPGITPKPKALNVDADIDLFLKKRNLDVNESRITETEDVDKIDPKFLFGVGHKKENFIALYWYSLETGEIKITTSFGEKHSDAKWADIAFKPGWTRGRVCKVGNKYILSVYNDELLTNQLLDIIDKVNNFLSIKVNRVIDKGGKDLSYMLESVDEDIKESFSIERFKVQEANPFMGVHSDKKKWIKTGDETLNQILPKLPDKEQTYLTTIASVSYAETVKRVEEFTGIKVKPSNLPSLVYLLMATLHEVTSIEGRNKHLFEELALDLVFSVPEFKVVEQAFLSDEISFDIKIDSPDLIRLTKSEEDTEEDADLDGLSKDEDLNLKMAEMLKDSSDEDIRRRFSNLMTSGGAVHKLYLFNMAADRLKRVDSRLPGYYGILSSVAQLGYWVTPDGIEMAAAGGEVSSAGSEEVTPQGDKYVIKVRGTTFPYLVHELVKGIYEYLSLDPSTQIAMKKDTLEGETKDIIAGPEVYKVVMSYIPGDKQELTSIVQKKLVRLSPKEIRDVLSKNDRGRQIMNNLISEAEKEWTGYKKSKEEYTEQEV